MSTQSRAAKGQALDPPPGLAAQAWARFVPRPWAWPSMPIWTGCLALAVAALAAVWTTRLHSADATDRLRLIRLKEPTRPAAAAASTLADEQGLLAALPAAVQGAERVAALLALAATHGVTIDSVRQAAPLPLASGQAALAAERVVVLVRASGPYLGLRQWVAQALQHDDALLLERLRLSRPAATSPVLAAELNWALLQGITGPAP